MVDLVPAHTKGKRMWLCHCVCGTWRVLPTERLTTGNTKSCGCLRKESCAAIGKASRYTTAPGEAGFNTVLRKYKWGARNRSLSFDITAAEVRKLTSSNCHYCDRAPEQRAVSGAKKPNSVERTVYLYNGIDRKDPTIGYTPENCVTACSDCNLAKQSLSYDAFLALISRIHSYRNKEAS